MYLPAFTLQLLLSSFLICRVSGRFFQPYDLQSIQGRDVQGNAISASTLNQTNAIFEDVVSQRLRRLRSIVPRSWVLQRVWAWPTSLPQRTPESFTRITIDIFDTSKKVHLTTSNTRTDPYAWSSIKENEDQEWGLDAPWEWSERSSTLSEQMQRLQSEGWEENFENFFLGRPMHDLLSRNGQLYWTWHREITPPGKSEIIYQGDVDHHIYDDDLAGAETQSTNVTSVGRVKGNSDALSQIY